MSIPSLVWLRRDLRLADHAALVAACAAGPVVPVYVLDDETAAPPPHGRGQPGGGCTIRITDCP